MRIILIFVVAYTSGLFAMPEVEQEELAEQALVKMMKSLGFISADYTKIMKIGSLTKKEVGHLDILDKGCFRMNSETPYIKEAVFDGTYLWDYDKNLKQVIKKKFDPSEPLPILLLTGEVERFLSSVVVKEHQSPHLYYDIDKSRYDKIFVLYSDDDKNFFQIIEIILKSGKPAFLHILGLDDSLIRFEFYDFSDEKPAGDICKFKVPKGVEMLDVSDMKELN